MPSVAEFISEIINSQRIPRAVISKATGLSPTTISMIKSGATKLPLARLKHFAQAIGVPPKDLFFIALQEYQPDLLTVIEDLYEGATPQRQPLDDYLSLKGGSKKPISKPAPSWVSKEDRDILAAVEDAMLSPVEFKALLVALRAYAKELSPLRNDNTDVPG